MPVQTNMQAVMPQIIQTSNGQQQIVMQPLVQPQIQPQFVQMVAPNGTIQQVQVLNAAAGLPQTATGGQFQVINSAMPIQIQQQQPQQQQQQQQQAPIQQQVQRKLRLMHPPLIRATIWSKFGFG